MLTTTLKYLHLNAGLNSSKLHKLGLSLITVFCCTWVQAQTVLLDKIIAIVDNDVVMASELDRQIKMIKSRLQAQNTELPPEDILRSQVLEHLIVERLQLQMAERQGLEISESDLDQALARMQQANKLSREQFIEQLRQEGMSLNTLKEQIRREMLINQIQKGFVNRRIRISNQEINNFLNSKEGKFWTSPDYRLGHILIPVSPSASADDASHARALAENIYLRLKRGEDFKQLAIAHSGGQRALQGGDLGWRKTAQLPGLFAEMVPSLEVGGVSQPFRSDAGYHILKLYEKKGGGQQIVKQSKVRHILVKPSTILSDEDARKKLIKLRQQILDGAEFAEVAREHSEDIGSMLSGGDLGWSTPGQFVPAFESTMEQTPVGAISDPFRTQFGWHILKVEDRREQDMSEQVIRNQARNILRKRRFEEELQNWLQEKRDEAYVELKE